MNLCLYVCRMSACICYREVAREHSESGATWEGSNTGTITGLYSAGLVLTNTHRCKLYTRV